MREGETEGERRQILTVRGVLLVDLAVRQVSSDQRVVREPEVISLVAVEVAQQPACLVSKALRHGHGYVESLDAD